MVTFTINYSGFMAMTAVQRKRLFKQAFEAMGIMWHTEFRAKHFTHRGATEYRYAKRSGEAGNTGSKGFRRSYTGRKLRQKGHTRPLVWSGESERRSRTRKVIANAKRVRIILNTPALNFRNRNSKINMREEMTRVSDAEKTALLQRFEDTLVRSLSDLRATKTVRIGRRGAA